MSRQAEHPLDFGLSPGAELQERAISGPRVIRLQGLARGCPIVAIGQPRSMPPGWR
jgi:hypothetical protein